MSRVDDRGRAHPPVATGGQGLPAQRRSGLWRAVGLTALGTALPGAGLTQTRNRVLGWLLLAVALLSGVALAWVVLTKGLRNTVLDVVTSPGTLRAIAIVFVVAGVIWCASIILTAMRARPTRLDRTRTRVLAAFTTLMVFFVAAGSLKVAEYATITQDTVSQVFGAPSTSTGIDGKASEPQVVQGQDPWADQPRLNILLLGSDAGADRTGVRTDSMIVASIDTKTGRTTLISLPRNLLKAPLAPDSPLRARYTSGFFGSPDSTCAQGPGQCMLTNLWEEAENYKKDNPGSYPGDSTPGRTEIRGAIQQIVGMDINQLVIIDLKGFQQLIDAMGGIDVNVKDAAFGGRLPIGGHADGFGHITGVTGYFTPGFQHLNGQLALWYARSRAADSDTYRQARQRCVVQAIVKQVNPARMVSKYPEIAKIAKDNIYTDISASNLSAFVTLVDRIQASTINSVSLTSAEGVSSTNPDYAKVRAMIEKAIKTPPPTTPTTPSATATPSTSTPTPTTPATPSPTTTPYEQCS